MRFALAVGTAIARALLFASVAALVGCGTPPATTSPQPAETTYAQPPAPPSPSSEVLVAPTATTVAPPPPPPPAAPLPPMPKRMAKSVSAARFRIDELNPGRAATTTIGGMPDRNGQARIRKSKSAQVQFYVYGGASGTSFEKIALFTRPVTVEASNQPRPAGCGAPSVKHDKWKAAGPPIAHDTTPIDTGRIWDLRVLPGKRHFITLGAKPAALDDNVAVTFIVQLVEAGGKEHWLESDAVHLVHVTCPLP